jgi:hypothetical protein
MKKHIRISNSQREEYRGSRASIVCDLLVSMHTDIALLISRHADGLAP